MKILFCCPRAFRIGEWRKVALWLGLLWLTVSASYAETLVGNYRADFRTGTMPARWSYLWNYPNSFGTIANYVLLQADSSGVWDTDASHPGRPDNNFGVNLFLGPTGGFPGSKAGGSGIDKDAYAIAAFTVPTAGYYRIGNSSLKLTNTASGGSVDGVIIRIHTGDEHTWLSKTVLPQGTIDFNVSVGWLPAGEKIYCGVGENGNGTKDDFDWDFSIYQSDTPPAPPNLNALTLLGSTFPRSFFFRVEGKADNTSGKTYDKWKANYGRLDGIMAKALPEEILYAPDAAAYMHVMAADLPSQAMLLHMNGWACQPLFARGHLSAGHWLYFPGCKATAAIGAQDTVIQVENGALFRTLVSTDAGKPDEMVIVPLDDAGNRLWAGAEQVRLVAINGNQLTIERNIDGSAPANRTFNAGKAYVAPHAWTGPFGNNLLWMMNFSDQCPLDAQGKNAGDAMTDWLASLFGGGGILERFAGLEFDVARFLLPNAISGRKIDSDNDGTFDGGIVGGLNHYGIGVHQFYTKLRAALGPDRIIMADGGDASSQRAVDMLNGMESEGFSDPVNDPYLKDWSSNINRFQFWQQACQQPRQLSYIVHKNLPSDGSDPVNPPNLARLVFATGQAIGLPVLASNLTPNPEPDETDGIWDEVRRGSDRVYHWLGNASAPMVRLAPRTADLLAGAGASPSTAFMAALTSTEATLTRESNQVRVSSNATGVANGKMTVNLALSSLAPSLPAAGDFYLRFESMANALPGFSSAVPRQIKVTVDGRNASTETATQVFGFTGTIPVGFVESGHYFRNAFPATSPVVHIEFEGATDVVFRNFTVHASADAMAREFDNGIVLSNPSLNPYTFDLASLFPGRSFKRLTASSQQDSVTNDGSAVGNQVTIPARDGLFLIKLDVTPPNLSSISLSSSNAAPARAKAGDVVTLSFVSNETIQTPSVTLFGVTATVSSPSTNHWSATAPVVAGSSQGAVAFSISASDSAGNAAALVTATSDGSQVVIDTAAPVLTLPGSPLVATATSVAGAAVSFAVSGSDAPDGAVTATATPASGSFFNVGDTTVQVAARDLAGNAVAGNFVVRVLTAAQAWRQQNFGTTQNTGSAADNADYDGDGLKNLLERAFGTDPKDPASGASGLTYSGSFASAALLTPGRPVTRMESVAGSVDFRALFVRLKSYQAEGLAYAVEFSADLVAWQTSGATPAVIADNGTLQLVTVPYPLFIGGQKARFFRVTCTSP